MTWIILGSICGLFIVAAVAFVAYIVIREKKLKAYALEHGEKTHGWLVQANAALYEAGDTDLPALVIISPDEETNDDEQYMTELAERIMELKDPDGEILGDTKAERFVSKLMSDETYIEGKREKLPEKFTEGRTVYLAHILVYREHLPRQKLDEAKLPCVVVWDDPKAMVCTRPTRKRKRTDDEEE